MKILITGAKGFIGRHMYTALSHHELITMDWGDAMPDLAGLDWVIHLGAISSTTERDVEKVLSQNLDFSVNLLHQCIAAGVNLQYASSASIYGLGQDFRETAPADPRTPYAWSKYLFERTVTATSHPGIIVQGFRYFNVYGDGEEHKGGQASPFTQFRLQAQANGRIRLFHDSDKFFRDFVPVQQLVEVHQRFFHVPESGVWNVGTGQVQSFQSIAESFGVPLDFVPMPPELVSSYQRYTCADLGRITATLEKYKV